MFKLATVWNFISIFNVCSGQVSTHPFGLEDYNVATIGAFGDAEHRGVRWYDDKHSSNEKASNLKSSATLDSSSISSGSYVSSSLSSEASSIESSEKKLMTKAYRQCTPCPHDMLKSYNNLGVKWICGAYQRARRSFKSECMMRYRNCQDGTMFVKVSERRCANNSYHGRHWFYIYKV
ncbi:uncharacterized protein LOC126975584 [Leptidea sinapis]|uniref:uncharacterized protein LOC126975584 n=1 Tax=Leptidea sinapis TaxID=189913 RepID=UPI002128A8BD|nr:uncharacterized protein LOC126975584 [Leptidea sinapis]